MTWTVQKSVKTNLSKRPGMHEMPRCKEKMRQKSNWPKNGSIVFRYTFKNYFFKWSFEVNYIFFLQVNSQLLEAIQQKVELSQQLEQWQVDMEQLLEGQMRERLLYGDKRVHSSASAMSVSSECSDTGNGNTQPRTASRIFSFFQRNWNWIHDTKIKGCEN